MTCNQRVFYDQALLDVRSTGAGIKRLYCTSQACENVGSDLKLCRFSQLLGFLPQLANDGLA